MLEHCGDSTARMMMMGSLLVIGTLVMTMAAARNPSLQSDPAPSRGENAAGNSSSRTVLITGANRGLGLEFAKQYKEAGWNVIGTSRDPGKASDLKAVGVTIEALDVADQASVDAFAARLKDQPIDVLINNAGIGGDGGSLREVKMADFEQVMNVNAIGPVRVTKALLPNLRAGKSKIIVGISSLLGSIEENQGGGYPGYRESKASLNMTMRSLAGELKGDGFICIPMSPGWVKTDMGGPNAELTPEESISGMRKVIDGLKPEDSGKFWRHDGTIVPW